MKKAAILNSQKTTSSFGLVIDQAVAGLSKFITNMTKSKTYIIIGPNLEHMVDNKNFHLENQNYNIEVIYSTQTNIIEISKPKLNENSRVIIFAHGERVLSMVGKRNGPHELELAVGAGYFTHRLLMDLAEAARGKALNVELLSCFGGAAIEDIKFLPQNSSLITFSSGLRHLYLLAPLSAYVNLRCDNQFLSFASYVCYHPETTRFAINTRSGIKYFMNEITTLKDRSIEGVIEWKDRRLTKYLTFLEQIKSSVSEENKKRIAQCIEAINSKELRHRLINSYDQEEYVHRIASLLFEACKRGDKTRVKILLENGHDVNSRAYLNQTILHELAGVDSGEMMGFLFEVIKNLNEEKLRTEGLSYHKIEILIDVIDDYKRTPLYVAITTGKTNNVKHLLENGSNPNFRGFKGNTAFHYAISSNSFIEDSIFSILASKGAEIDCLNEDGMTALQLGIVLPYTEDRVRQIKILIRLGANVNLPSEEGFSALYLAEKSNRIDLVKILLVERTRPVLDLMKIIQAPKNDDVNRDEISESIARVVAKLIKDASGWVKDDEYTWKIIEDKIIKKLPEDMLLPVVTKALKDVSNPTRRTRLSNLLSEDKKATLETFSFSGRGIRETLQR